MNSACWIADYLTLLALFSGITLNSEKMETEELSLDYFRSDKPTFSMFRSGLNKALRLRLDLILLVRDERLIDSS